MKRIGIVSAVLLLFLFAQAAQAQWSPARRITWTSSDSYKPKVAIDSSGCVYVVWEDEFSGHGTYQVYYKKSTNGGATWTASKRLTWTWDNSWYPSLALDPSFSPHVVWQDKTPGNCEVFYKKSSDEGSTWTFAKRLTWNPNGSFFPAIAVDSSGNVHVVFVAETPDGKGIISYKKSTDGGVTWTAIKRLSSMSGNSECPAIAVAAPGNIHVVWNGNGEIHCRTSTDGGVTWTSSQRLTWNYPWSENPDIAIDPSDNLHVVWDDATPGNFEIYYKKFVK